MSRTPAENTARYLDAVELARTETAWECDFKATRFPRLSEAAAVDTPAVSVRLRFAQWDGRPAIHGRISGEVELVCQRCLKPLRHRIDEAFELVLVSSEEELDAVPEPYEPAVVDAAKLDVRWLVEEQLLLAIPLIPKHEDESECQRASNMPPAEKIKEVAAPEDKRQRPFANLRELLRK